MGLERESADRLLNAKKSAGQTRRSSFSSAFNRLAAIDAYAVNAAVRSNIAAEAEVRRVGVIIAEGTVGADAIRTVAIISVAATARETAHPDHAVAARADLGHRNHPAARRIGTKDDTENSANAG